MAARALLLLAFAPLAALASAQVDIRDLDRRLPTQLNDAYPLEKGDLQLHNDLRYDRDPREDRFGSSPELQYGFAEGWYVQVGIPVFFRGDRLGSGNVEVELFRGSADLESPRLALAAALRAVVPTGVGARGLDTDVEIIATQPLRMGLHEVRAHLNVAWEHNASPLEDERQDGYLGVLGLGVRIDRRSMALLDFARDQDPRERDTTNLAEVGFIRGLGRKQELALGLGFRLDRASPATRLTIGYQASL